MEERWRPWIDALRHAVTLDSKPSREASETARATGVVWMCWYWTASCDQDADSVRLVFEAFELLALVAHADQAAWRWLMTHWWPDASSYWENVPLPQVFQCGCQVHVATTGSLGRLSERLLCDIDHVVSDEYRQLRSELEAAFKAKCDPQMTVVVRVILVVDCNFGLRAADTLSPLLFEIVLGLQYTSDHTPLVYARKWKPLFRIEKVDVCGFFSSHMPTDLQYLNQIASCGVEVDDLQLNNVEITHDTAPEYTSMLQRFLAANDADTCSSFSPTTAVQVHQDATIQTYDGIFSALLHSKSVQDYWHMTPDDEHMDTAAETGDTPARDRLWQWMALAIFSSTATNPIKNVYYYGKEISMAKANAFERVLMASNPMSVLFPGSTTSTSFSILTASEFRLGQEFSDLESSPSLSTTSPVEWRHILGDAQDGEWLAVLLPGWGKAWVKKADAKFAQRSHASMDVWSIKWMFIDTPDTCLESMVKVLRAVGNGIKHLELENEDEDTPSLPSEWLGVCSKRVRASRHFTSAAFESSPLTSFRVVTRTELVE